MKRQTQAARTEVRGLIRRPTGRFLLVRPAGPPDGPWELPGGPCRPRQDPVTQLRQLCATRLGVNLEECIPQVPFRYGQGVATVHYRCYLCPVRDDAVLPLGYAAVRWCAATELGDYAVPGWTRILLARLGIAPGDPPAGATGGEE